VRRAWAAVGLALAFVACQTRRVASTGETDREAPPTAGEERSGARARTDDAGPPVPATPDGLLAPGGARRVQEALVARGHLGAARSDEIDDATSAALRRLQREEGLAATGFPDRETLRRLGLDPAEVYARHEDERR
jgi:hypothetical protein